MRQLLSEYYLKLLMNIGLFFLIGSIHAQESTSEFLMAISKYPDSLLLHQQFIKEVNLKEDELIKKYDSLLDKFPKNSVIPFALGEALWNKELPEAKPYLLKAVGLNPKLAKAYFYLWIDGERWGDFETSREYLLKAKEIEPNNPDYAFYYAGTFNNSDHDKYLKLSLEVADRFPDSERGAQSLYWLANRSSSLNDKLQYLKLLKEKFPPSKFSWSSSGMYQYFDILLESAPDQAIALAELMLKNSNDEKTQNTWKDQLLMAQNIVKANHLLAGNKPSEAYAVLESSKLFRWSNAKNFLLLLKAKALNQAGSTEKAYNILKNTYASSPEPDLREDITKYAAQLNKNKKDVERDIWDIRDSLSQKATDFSLKQYLEPGEKSLADYKGKVILLTYWFPGCGPCRGEFPHFQNVVDKFEGRDLVYLGLNIASEQNDYVVPFMKSSGYSFIPLEDYKERKKGNLDNRGAAPVNFLIDREGNIVYSNFRTDSDNENVLEAMITSLVYKKI